MFEKNKHRIRYFMVCFSIDEYNFSNKSIPYKAKHFAFIAAGNKETLVVTA